MKNKFILFLFVFVLCAIIYRFRPLNYEFNPAKKELYISRINYEKMSENFKMGNYIESERTEYLERLDELNFNTELSQEQIIAVIYNCAAENIIQISSIKFYGADDSIYEDIEIVESNEKCKYEIMHASVEFKLTFDALLNFMDDIKNYGNDISITNIRIIDREDDLVYAVVDMKFYAVPSEVKI